MLQLLPAIDGHTHAYFTYDAETTRALPNAHRVPNMAANPIEFLKNMGRVWRIFAVEKPALILSTGAEIALPVLFVAKLKRVPMVYVECGAQFERPSFTGRFMYWFANAFYVQWPELAAYYGPRARYAGSLIDTTPPGSGAP